MNIQDVNVTDVLRVYSGVDGKCMCGCSGKYTTNPLYQAIASELRGYRIDNDECSLRTVKRILNKVKKASNVKREDDYFYFTDYERSRNGRIYVVYLVPSDEELLKKRLERVEFQTKQAIVAANKKYEALEALKGAGI